MSPCGWSVYWWAEDHESTCILPSTHVGLHTDGLRWFTDEGLQRPTELRTRGLVRARGARSTYQTWEVIQ